MAKRKPRQSQGKPDILKPFDVTKFGTDDDPCFGKLNDPKAPECQRCGDFEFCSIVMAQKLAQKRIKVEEKGNFKDLNKTPKIEEVRQFMKKRLEKYSKVKTVALAVKKFDISKEKAKTIIKNL
jgi:hypothetical protein